MPSQICLIDAKNFLYRNHYTHAALRGPDGEPTSVLYGCLNGLLSLSKRIPDTPLVMVWDGGGETWRHRFLRDHKKPEKIQPKTGTDWVGKQIANSLKFVTGGLPQVNVPQPRFAGGAVPAISPQGKPVGYKANRIEAEGSEKQSEREVALSQISELKRILRLLGIRNFKIKGLEGDDLIGILATAILHKKLFNKVIIHSSDTDFYQLLSHEITILKGLDREGNLIWFGTGQVKAEHNVDVKDWTKYRALTGDKSDNIPQLLAKVGPVRARQLLNAGVDASKGRHEVPVQAYNAVMDMTKGQLNFDDFWKRLRKNYIACQIMRWQNIRHVDQQPPMFDVNVVAATSNLWEQLSMESLLRDKNGLSERAYHEFCEWCIQHGMADLRGRAVDFGGLV